jgi:hypothetical protein
MRFPKGRHPSVNVIRRFDQRLREKKCNHDNYLHTVVFNYLLRCCHFHFHFLRVFSLTESCRTVLGTYKIGVCVILCYAMLLYACQSFLTHPIYSLCQHQITTNTAFYPENQPQRCVLRFDWSSILVISKLPLCT